MKQLVFATNFNISIIILILVTIILQLITTLNKKGELNRKTGILFIIIYLIYIGGMALKTG